MVIEITIPQTEGGGNFLELDPGTYDAVVTNIEEVDNPFEAEKTQLQITFEIVGYQNEDGTPCEKRAWANPVFNPQSKLYKWVSAIAGTVAPGEPFRTSVMVGKPCQVFVNTALGKDGKPALNKAGEEFTKIVDVLAPKKAAGGGKKPPLAARVAAEPATDVAEACFVCDEPRTKYDTKGRPVCDAHGNL